MKRIFAIIFVMVLFLSGCVHTPDPTGTVPTLVKPEIAPPKLVQVTRGEFRDYYAYHATVAPYSQGLFFDISGVIGNAYVYAGKAVKKGELLAELDHSALSARIVSLETDIADTETVAGYTDRMAKLQIDILKVELLQLEDQLAVAEETAVSRIRQQIALKKNEIAQAEADLRQEQALR
jgi:multidrug efflux pump subunit AcrA (membrane-fusion protein)